MALLRAILSLQVTLVRRVGGETRESWRYTEGLHIMAVFRRRQFSAEKG